MTLVCASRFAHLSPCYFSVYSVTTRPLAATLFPYTTLFRSLRAEASGPEEEGEARPDQPEPPGESGTPPAVLRRGVAQQPQRDRKSTRLNSSHVAISYAVFCLQKKKDQRSVLDVSQSVFKNL